MGVVYLAEQLRLKSRRVALKVILGGEFASERDIARFQEEADVLAEFDHPNIVPIIEVGQDRGRYFFTMKLLEGGSLEEKLHDLKTRPAVAVRLMARIARAVHAAHRAGILHRDLKASNILFDSSGEPYVTDFGLARLLQGDRSGGTRTHYIPGTPEYVAPERIEGPRSLTTASDIWSLGVLCYLLLAGRFPFSSSSIPALLRKICEDEPTPMPRGIPRDLKTICLKCLEKDPTRRYESAAALADDLDRWLEHRPVLARSAGPIERIGKWVRRHPWRALSLAAILVAMITPTAISIWFILYLNYSRGHHPIEPLTLGTNNLPMHAVRGRRATYNFSGEYFSKARQQGIRVEIAGVPAPVRENLALQIRADWAVLDDPARSPVLHHGDEFLLRVHIERRWLRDQVLYFESVGWDSDRLLRDYPGAAVRFILLDRPPDPAKAPR